MPLKEYQNEFRIENTYQWPADGECRPWTEFWVTTFNRPVGVAEEVYIHYSSDDGLTWVRKNMQKSCVSGEQEVWHINLDTFPANTRIQYAAGGTNAKGETVWDNRLGLNYHTVIGTNKDA